MIAGVGLILLGIAELVSTIPTGVCKPTDSGSCPTNTPYAELAIILIVLGVISLLLSKFEHSSSPENDAQEKSAKITNGFERKTAILPVHVQVIVDKVIR